MQNTENNNLKLTKQKETTFSFKVILKYWKKESKQLIVSLNESLCDSPEVFLNALKKHLEIKKEHCLEEVWIMQENKDFSKEIEWVKEIHGRIKIEISESYKDLLLKSGNKQFVDPNYTDKKTE